MPRLIMHCQTAALRVKQSMLVIYSYITVRQSRLKLQHRTGCRLIGKMSY